MTGGLHMSKEKKLVKNIFTYLIGSVASKIISFLLLPLYTYYLSQEEMGTFDVIFNTVSLVVPVITLSVVFAIFRFVLDSQENELTDSFLSNGLFVTFTGLILSLIPYLIISYILNIQNSLLIIFLLVTTALENTWKTTARALKCNMLFTVSGIILTLFTGLTGIVFVMWLKMGVRGLLLSYAVSPMISFVFLEYKLKLRKRIRWQLVDKNAINQMLKYSIPLMPTDIAWWLILSANRYFIRLNLGLSANGIFAVASKFPSLVSVVNSLFNMAWTESAIIEYNSETRNDYYTKIFNIFMRLQFSFVFILLPLIKYFIKFFIDESFIEAVEYIPFLLIGAVFQAFANFYGTGFLSSKDTKGAFSTTIVAAVVNVTMILLMINRIGLQAVCIANAVCFLCLWIIRILRTKKYFHISIDIREIVLFFLFLMISVWSYYRGSLIIDLVVFLIAVFILLYANKDLIKQVVKYLRSKYYTRNQIN